MSALARIALVHAAMLVVPLSAACEAPQKPFPDATVIQEPKPKLAWAPVQGANGYRMVLQSRVPEGRVLAATDTVVAASVYVPPQPLAEHRAKVTLRLKAICGTAESAETVTWFLIDTSDACRMGEIRNAGDSVSWDPVPGAKAYEVRRYDIADGRLIQTIATKETRIDIRGHQAAIIGVQPACAGGLGEAAYRTVLR